MASRHSLRSVIAAHRFHMTTNNESQLSSIFVCSLEMLTTWPPPLPHRRHHRRRGAAVSCPPIRQVPPLTYFITINNNNSRMLIFCSSNSNHSLGIIHSLSRSRRPPLPPPFTTRCRWCRRRRYSPITQTAVAATVWALAWGVVVVSLDQHTI